MWLSSPFSLPFIKATRKKAISEGHDSQASMPSLFKVMTSLYNNVEGGRRGE